MGKIKQTIIWSLFVMCFMSWMAQAAYAVQNYTLQIRDRPGDFPNGAVKLTFELSSNVNSTDTVVIAGDTLTVGDRFVTLGNGDRVSVVEKPVNPQKVVILYEPNSTLQKILATGVDPSTDPRLDPGDPLYNPTDPALVDGFNYCVKGNGSIFPLPSLPYDVQITWNGADADGYRMTSYTVASNRDCSKARRRIRSNAAVLTSIPSGVTNYGRHPLDVILVLDKSDSMGWPLPGSASGETRFDRLKTSVSQFVALWEQADAANLAGATIHDLSEDRLGLVFFDSNIHPRLFGSDIFKPRGSVAPGLNHNWQEVIEKVIAEPLGSGTKIAGGVIEGYSHWCDDGLVKNDATFLVFTDGVESTTSPPVFTLTNPRAFKERKIWGFIDPAWNDPNEAKSCTAESTTIPSEYTPAYSLGVPMLTIGLGPYTTAGGELLDDLGSQTAGKSTIAADGPALDAAFVDDLVELLKGSTLTLQKRTQASISASETMSSPVTTYFDGTVLRAVFVVGWEGEQNANAIQLEIRQPNGAIATPVAQQAGTHWAVQSVNLSSMASKGQWSLKLIRSQGSSVEVPYQASVYVVEGKLDWWSRIPKWKLLTGVPIQLETEIVYGGVPVNDLQSGAVKVYVERPVEAIGNIFREAPIGMVPKTWSRDLKLPIEEGPLRQYMLKLAYLEKTARLVERLAPRPVEKPLKPSGGKQGKYLTSYDEITKPGLYRFKVVLDWTSPKGERIQRVEHLERQVSLLASLNSQVTVTAGKEPGEYLVEVTPQDKFGNFAGPGYESAFAVEVKGKGKSVLPITDPNVNGSYVIRLADVPIKDDPRVKISFNGEPLRDERLSRLESTKETPPCRPSFCNPDCN